MAFRWAWANTLLLTRDRAIVNEKNRSTVGMVQTTIDKKENAPGSAAAVFTGRSGRGEGGRHGASTCLCWRRGDGGSPQQRAGNGTARSRAGAEARGKKLKSAMRSGKDAALLFRYFFSWPAPLPPRDWRAPPAPLPLRCKSLLSAHGLGSALPACSHA